jgi:hypothetical protein
MMLEREINQQTQIVAIPKTKMKCICDWIWHQKNQDKTHKKYKIPSSLEWHFRVEQQQQQWHLYVT